MTTRIRCACVVLIAVVAAAAAGSCGGGEKKAPEVEGSVTIDGKARTIEACKASKVDGQTVIAMTLDGGGVLTVKGTKLHYDPGDGSPEHQYGCTASTGIKTFNGQTEAELKFECADYANVDVKLACDG